MHSKNSEKKNITDSFTDKDGDLRLVFAYDRQNTMWRYAFTPCVQIFVTRVRQNNSSSGLGNTLHLMFSLFGTWAIMWQLVVSSICKMSSRVWVWSNFLHIQPFDDLYTLEQLVVAVVQVWAVEEDWKSGAQKYMYSVVTLWARGLAASSLVVMLLDRWLWRNWMLRLSITYWSTILPMICENDFHLLFLSTH